MGRLTGIEHFFSRAAYEEEKQDTRDLRPARKELPEGSEEINEDRNAVKLKQVEIARRMFNYSKGHLIFRTKASLNWKGDPLITLPPLRTEYVYLDLTERELKVIAANGKLLQEKLVIDSLG